MTRHFFIACIAFAVALCGVADASRKQTLRTPMCPNMLNQTRALGPTVISYRSKPGSNRDDFLAYCCEQCTKSTSCVGFSHVVTPNGAKSYQTCELKLSITGYRDTSDANNVIIQTYIVRESDEDSSDASSEDSE